MALLINLVCHNTPTIAIQCVVGVFLVFNRRQSNDNNPLCLTPVMCIQVTSICFRILFQHVYNA